MLKTFRISCRLSRDRYLDLSRLCPDNQRAGTRPTPRVSNPIVARPFEVVPFSPARGLSLTLHLLSRRGRAPPLFLPRQCQDIKARILWSGAHQRLLAKNASGVGTIPQLFPHNSTEKPAYLDKLVRVRILCFYLNRGEVVIV